MGLFRKKSSPPMTEIYPSPLLKKFDSGRSSADVLAFILHISEGIYAMKSNDQKPKFSSISEFDTSASELLGSLDEETFPRLVQMLLFETEYLNRFIEISIQNLHDAFAELGRVLNRETPLSAQSIQRISPISNKIDFLVQEFSQVASELGEHVSTDSISAISGILIKSREFKVDYVNEIQRSISYVKEFRDN